MKRALPFLLLATACTPELERRASLVDRARMVAIVTEPAESEPGESVRYLPLVATPEGTLADPAIAWAMCRTPRAPTESRSVSPACLSDGAVGLGVGSALDATTPEDVCFLFGPETPTGDFRPRDPDPTGGYYLPMRAALDDELTFSMHRIRCNLANAPVDASLDYAERYRSNENPIIDALELSPGAEVAPASRIEMLLRWSESSAERYLAYDAGSRSLVERREGLRVSWFATAGRFEHDATGRSGADPDLVTSNVWIAPDDARDVHVWAVLRDERGGTAFTAALLHVGP